jgi:hypothetical protein
MLENKCLEGGGGGGGGKKLFSVFRDVHSKYSEKI